MKYSLSSGNFDNFKITPYCLVKGKWLTCEDNNIDENIQLEKQLRIKISESAI